MTIHLQMTLWRGQMAEAVEAGHTTYADLVALVLELAANDVCGRNDTIYLDRIIQVS